MFFFSMIIIIKKPTDRKCQSPNPTWYQTLCLEPFSTVQDFWNSTKATLLQLAGGPGCAAKTLNTAKPDFELRWSVHSRSGPKVQHRNVRSLFFVVEYTPTHIFTIYTRDNMFLYLSSWPRQKTSLQASGLFETLVPGTCLFIDRSTWSTTRITQ